MKKHIMILIIAIILISGCTQNNSPDETDTKMPPTPPIKAPKTDSGFCGTSTNGPCNDNSDCTKGGCSSQVCQSKNEEPIMTTCEYMECYSAIKYNVNCICKEFKCQWA